MSGGGRIGALVSKVEALGGAELQRRVMERVAESARRSCLDGFEQQRDPYGMPWARRIDVKGTWPILNKTGSGPASVTAVPSGDLVRMSIDGVFKFHQYGTSKMVARRVFPIQSRGLGLWGAPAREAAMSAVREAMQ